jgi:hypothetical protein
VNCKFVSCLAVLRDAVLFFHVGSKGNNICDAVWMEPHCSVSREVTGEVRCCAAGLRRELHLSLHGTDVLQQLWVRENVERGLVVQEDLGYGKSLVAC